MILLHLLLHAISGLLVLLLLLLQLLNLLLLVLGILPLLQSLLASLVVTHVEFCLLRVLTHVAGVAATHVHALLNAVEVVIHQLVGRLRRNEGRHLGGRLLG